jgi:hypothetical protein
VPVGNYNFNEKICFYFIDFAFDFFGPTSILEGCLGPRELIRANGVVNDRPSF